MVNTEPDEDYEDAVVLYHWTKCGHCVRLMPEWEEMKRSLPGSTQVYELEVEENRERLRDLGVDLGSGVPRIEAYNSEGDKLVYDGDRTADAMAPVIGVHLISASPATVEESTPCTVLYFSHRCGFCVRFLPEFLKFATGAGVGTVFAVDTGEYPDATDAPTVPHVVYIGSDGSTSVFQGDRTRAELKKFVSDQEEEGPRNVSFEGGSLRPVRDSTKVQLDRALDALQDKASTTLGKRFRRAFEPENSSVCFIGRRTSSTPGKDRVFILLCPQKIPRNKPPVMAGIYGDRSSDLTIKIYTGTNMDTFLTNKRGKGFKPVLETDPNVQALHSLGYYVEMS